MRPACRTCSSTTSSRTWRACEVRNEEIDIRDRLRARVRTAPGPGADEPRSLTDRRRAVVDVLGVVRLASIFAAHADFAGERGASATNLGLSAAGHRRAGN